MHTCGDGLASRQACASTHTRVPGEASFLWLLHSPLEIAIEILLLITVTSRVEKSHPSCFLPAPPPVGKAGDVSLGHLGVSRRSLPSGLYGGILPPAFCSPASRQGEMKAAPALAQGVLKARACVFFSCSESLLSPGNCLCGLTQRRPTQLSDGVQGKSAEPRCERSDISAERLRHLLTSAKHSSSALHARRGGQRE